MQASSFIPYRAKWCSTVDTTHFCFILLLVGIWVTITLWILGIRWLWTILKYILYAPMFPFLLRIYRSRITQSYGNTIFNILRSYETVSKATAFLCIPNNSVWRFQFFQLLTTLVIITSLVGQKCYLIIVLIWISLMTNHVIILHVIIGHLYIVFIYLYTFKFSFLLFYCWIARIIFIFCIHFYIFGLKYFSDTVRCLSFF